MTSDPNQAEKAEHTNQFDNGVIFALILTGFGIGWLAGLSVSPVVSVVITSILGAAAAVVTALCGLKEDRSTATSQPFSALSKISAWPLAFLVSAVVIGSWWGNVARNNHLFGSDVESEIKKWTDVGVPKEAVLEKLFGTTATYSPYSVPITETLQLEIDRWASLGIPKEQVVLRLFEQHFADNQPTAQSRALLAPDERMGTFLYAAAIQEECDAWQKLINKNSYDELTRQVSTSEVLSFRQLPTIITDTVKLATIVEEVLCAETQP